MSRAWQEAVPAEGPSAPWAGPAVAAAAAVPLGAALVIAGGLLPWGARIVLGAALVVLGAAGWRSPVAAGPVARAVGTALLVGGALLVAGGAAAGVAGGGLDTRPVDRSFLSGYGAGYVGLRTTGELGVLPALVLSLLAALAGLLALLRAPGDGADRAAVRNGGWAGAAAVLVGSGLALAFVVLTGDGALGLGDDVRDAPAVLAAAVAALVALGRPGDDAPGRAAAVLVGALLALTLGEATGLVDLVTEGSLRPAQEPSSWSAIRGFSLVVGAATSAVLLAAAVSRRDAVIGVLPAGVLLAQHDPQGTAEHVGLLLVPSVAAVLLVGAVAGRGPLAGRWDRPSAAVALAAAGVALLVAVEGAVSPGVLRGFDEVATGTLVTTGVAAVGALLGVVALARATPGAARTALAVVLLVGLYVLHPLWTATTTAPDAFLAREGLQAAALVLELAAAGAIAGLARRPLPLAAAGLVLGDVLGHLAGLAFLDRTTTPSASAWFAIGVGPSLAGLLVAAAVVLVGPARLVRGAQAVAGGLALALALAVASSGSILATAGDRYTTEDVATAPLRGGGLVVAVALVGLVVAAGALLAAGTARRRSGPVASVAVLLALVTGVLAAGVGAARSARPADPEGGAGVPLTDALLGFRTTTSPLEDAGGGWTVALGLSAAGLLGVAWWLQRRERRARPGADEVPGRP
jgi:hypothetical protein